MNQDNILTDKFDFVLRILEFINYILSNKVIRFKVKISIKKRILRKIILK